MMRALQGLTKAALAMLISIVAVLGILIHSSLEQQLPGNNQVKADCLPPTEWSAHLVQVGESLTELANIVGVSAAELVLANCLQGDVHPGDTIYLPPPIARAEACGPPEGWLLYELQPGDSLPLLASQFSVSETAIWHANCMSEDMTFRPGFRIYVPPIAGAE